LSVVALGMVKVVSTYRLKKGRFEDNFLVFEMDGEQYIREWTSLTGERVKNDPAFAVTMAYANVQTLASKTSSRVYEQVTGERHVYPLFVLLKKIAYQLFKKGYSIETVYSWLLEAVSEKGFWWEEWAAGKEEKLVVLEIVRILSEPGFRGIIRIEGKGPAAVGEVSRKDAKRETRKDAKKNIQHLDHKEHKETLSEDLVDLSVLSGKIPIRVRSIRSKRSTRVTHYTPPATLKRSLARLHIPFMVSPPPYKTSWHSPAFEKRPYPHQDYTYQPIDEYSRRPSGFV